MFESVFPGLMYPAVDLERSAHLPCRASSSFPLVLTRMISEVNIPLKHIREFRRMLELIIKFCEVAKYAIVKWCPNNDQNKHAKDHEPFIDSGAQKPFTVRDSSPRARDA